jgi:AmiR/NasT family two-component response regulator
MNGPEPGPVNSRIIIEQAKGILAERAGVDMEHAFRWLRTHARRRNLRLVDVAESVINGSLAPDPPRPKRPS